MDNLQRGQKTTPKQLIDAMGDAAKGVIVTGGFDRPLVVVAIDGNVLKLVSLESKGPVATDVITTTETEDLFVVANPDDAITQFQARFHLIAKAWGLRH